MEPNDSSKIIYVKDENGEYVPESDRYKRPKKSRVLSALERRKRIIFWVRFAILALIEIAICFLMPEIASSPLPLTLAAAPVAIVGILYGPLLGSAIGGIGGVTSMLLWTFAKADSPIAFVFSPFVNGGGIQSLLISIVPLVLAGLVAGLISTGITTVYEHRTQAENAKKAWWHMPLIYVICAASASLVYTLFTVTGIYICFSHSFALAAEFNESLVLIVLGGIVLSKGLLESLMAAISSVAVCTPYRMLKNKSKGKADA